MESARLKALLRFSINPPFPGILAGVESYGMAIEDLPAVIAVQVPLSQPRGVGSWILFGPPDLPDIQVCLEFRGIREFALSFVDKASAEFVGSIPARPFDLKWPDKPSRVCFLCRVTIFIDGAGDHRLQGILVVPRDFQQSRGAGEINSPWKFRVFDALFTVEELPFEMWGILC